MFDVTDCRERYQYRADIAPVLTDTFRFVIRASARKDYPTASQISTVELYPEPESAPADRGRQEQSSSKKQQQKRNV